MNEEELKQLANISGNEFVREIVSQYIIDKDIITMAMIAGTISEDECYEAFEDLGRTLAKSTIAQTKFANNTDGLEESKRSKLVDDSVKEILFKKQNDKEFIHEICVDIFGQVLYDKLHLEGMRIL